MQRQFSRAIILATLATAITVGSTACSQPPETKESFDTSSLFTGAATPRSFAEQARIMVTEASRIAKDKDTQEATLVLHIEKINAMLSLAKSLQANDEVILVPELLSSLGSLYSKQAMFHSDNAKLAGSYAAKGFRYLDRAVAKYPTNITARLNRGLVSAHVPEFLNKTQVAKDDLEFVVASEGFSNLPKPLQQAIQSTLQLMTSRLNSNA